MSATGRGVRGGGAHDYFPTPAWCVRRLLERVDLPGGHWLEPAVGDGAIVAAVDSIRSDVYWTAIDIRQVTPPLDYSKSSFIRRDFLSYKWTPDRAVVITNPPYSLALEFVKHSLPIAPYVAMLLRVNFLGSAKRSAFFRSEMPDVYVLPNRPSFTGGGTDATEYCWAIWTPERGRRQGRVEVLAETPKTERTLLISEGA